MAKPSHCIDTLGEADDSGLGLYDCAGDKGNPQNSQFFTLRHFRDIELKATMFCFDQNGKGELVTAICHNSQGNQYFRYNLDTKQIYHGSVYRKECIDMDETSTNAGAVFFAKCDESSLTQKWSWGWTNQTALDNWITSGIGVELIDKKEVEALSDS